MSNKAEVNPGTNILVRYRSPSNVRGARWLVSVPGYKTRTYPRNYELNADEDAGQVAVEYARKHGLFKWARRYVVYTIKPGEWLVVPMEG